MRIAAGKAATPRSWLLVSDNGNDQQSSSIKRDGYISQGQDLFVATPFDALFFLLPLISSEVSTSEKSSKKALFKILDDYIDSAPAATASKLSLLLRDPPCRALFEKRLRVVCNVVEAGDETMFRLSQEKLTSEIQAKAQRLVKQGLPASLEDKFITRALEIPISGQMFASVHTKESPVSGVSWKSGITEMDGGVIHRLVEEEGGPKAHMSLLEQRDDPSITLLTQAPATPAQFISDLLRTQTAINFILRSYVPAHLHAGSLESTKELDFTPLEVHVEHLAKIRSQAQALRSISNNISRKRNADEDEPIDADLAKRRKKEEEDKKKKMASHGVKALSKVNTNGMKKMSSFFTKKSSKS